MFHKHLTLERYEVAAEESLEQGEALRLKAAGCPHCAATVGEQPLQRLLATWEGSSQIDRPVPWEAALKQALESPAPPVANSRPRRWRPVLVLGLVAALLLVSLVQASASAGPDSPLYGVRGTQDWIRGAITPEPERARLETKLANGYLGDARHSAVRDDQHAASASMERFSYWMDRLRTDIKQSARSERPEIRASLAVTRSVLSDMAAAGFVPAAVARGQSTLKEVEDEFEAESHEGD